MQETNHRLNIVYKTHKIHMMLQIVLSGENK